MGCQTAFLLCRRYSYSSSKLISIMPDFMNRFSHLLRMPQYTLSCLGSGLQVQLLCNGMLIRVSRSAREDVTCL